MAGFIRGILWGGVVALGGLVAVSQLVATPDAAREAALKAPVPDQPANSEPTPVEKPSDPVEPPQALPEPEPVPKPEPDPVPEPKVDEADASQTDATVTEEAGNAPAVEPVAPQGQTLTDGESGPVAPSVTDGQAPTTAETPALADPAKADQVAEQPVAPQEAPAQPPSVAPPDAMTELLPGQEPKADIPATVAGAPEAVAAPAPMAPEGDAEPQTAELPPPPPLSPEEEALLQPAPEPTVPVETAPVAKPVEPAPPPSSVLQPTPGLTDAAEGVITGRLPRIGETDGEEGQSDEPAPAAAADYDPALDESLPPLQRYARAFENPDQKPIFAILLEDKGEDVNRAELAAMDLALTIVIDPLSDGAADHAAIWRAGGQEVVLSAESLPDGATPGDLEQIFQALSSRLPESVAVIDASASAFQNNRQLAAQIVPILADQGRGLVTFEQGLNAADQVARREGLASATIFRRFDPDNAAGPAVKRYLDRAVFKAAQEGRVAVIGSLRTETIAGLLEWAVEGRASTVAVAPISALLQR